MPGLDEEVFNLELRKFLKRFGVTAQREIERAVRNALAAGALRGDERLHLQARVTIGGLAGDIQVEGEVALA